MREVKRLDDKLLLVEIQLLESHVHYALLDVPKARAALTSSRTAANAVYCPPELQMQIDMQAGKLHAEEGDYKTAFSYFFEAFETAHSLEDADATQALKLMLLCKIMADQSADVHALISSKTAIQYAGSTVEAMKAVAEAHQKRSVHAFEAAVKNFSAELEEDKLVAKHFKKLYDGLLESNLIRLIEPFSQVELTHVAKLIDMPAQAVEDKLSQMILDKRFEGVIDQSAGNLIVYPSKEDDKTYPLALETIQNLADVVDSLFEKANTLRV